MEEKQAEFLRTLIDCGASSETLLAVGMIIKTEASRKLMTKMILEEVDRGAEMNDDLIKKVFLQIMMRASEIDSNDKCQNN